MGEWADGIVRRQKGVRRGHSRELAFVNGDFSGVSAQTIGNVILLKLLEKTLSYTLSDTYNARVHIE